jgi:membrane associated rhomboid family serine protease
VRFRVLLSRFLALTDESRLLHYREGEAQLSLERPGKPPLFIVLIDGAREEERSLRLRIGRLASERVENQQIVIVANQSWMADALRKLGKEFWPKMDLYQLDADGHIELKARLPLRSLMVRLRAQRRIPLPSAGVPGGAGEPAALASETETEFAARCTQAEEEKTRLRAEYVERLQQRSTPVTLGLVLLSAALLGLGRLAPDHTTGLVQLGAIVPPFVRDGEWWRLLTTTFLHGSLLSGLLGGLVLLSLGTLLEKLLGSARFLCLYLLSGLGGGLLTLFWPRGSLVLISVGASGALCGLLGAGAVLAVDPGGLPSAEALRLRKIALGGLVTTAVLTLLPTVDRLTHLGGVLTGAVLLASSALRPSDLQINSAGKLAEPALAQWASRGVAALLGLVTLLALGLMLWNGPIGKRDTDWKKRLAASLELKRRKEPGPGAAVSTPDGQGEKDQPEKSDALSSARRELGDSGMSIELPTSLGEAQAKGEPGRTPVYEFGDLSEKQQLLSVVLQRPPRPLKRKAQLEEAFSQAVIQVKADKLRDDRVTELTPAARSSLDGWPLMEFHVRVQETVQARGVVQARNSAIVVLWYVFTDLLPENLQVDLKRALHSLQGSAPSEKKPAKKRR